MTRGGWGEGPASVPPGAGSALGTEGGSGGSAVAAAEEHELTEA